tara:strand:- start:148 stop:669 length:522 start_codon:yes stop_codon:yes gene_type:complete
LRIISGKYKNKKLISVSGSAVRPTTSLVKKSLFEIISPLSGKTVLDLFAGVGSLGIEALSRGARSATFVEKDKIIFKALSENINQNCDKSAFRAINARVEVFLNNNTDKYDIILADPPYNIISFESLKLKISEFLNKGGIFCMERKYIKDVYDNVRIKNYGKTQVLIWQKKEE